MKRPSAKEIIASMFVKLDADGDMEGTQHDYLFYTALAQRLIDKLAENGFHIARRSSRSDAKVKMLTDWLKILEPHLDAVICYASDMDEHPPNRVVKEAREYLSHLK